MALFQTAKRSSSFTTSNVMFYRYSKDNCPLVPEVTLEQSSALVILVQDFLLLGYPAPIFFTSEIDYTCSR